jgi:hypothetical protein
MGVEYMQIFEVKNMQNMLENMLKNMQNML